jgi:3-phenylpropionate/trans-cinnamate dioxygenase ferredoxin subunit
VTAVTLCRLDDLEHGRARRFDVDGHRIAVVRIDDDVYAIGDRCTHQDISLSEGEVDCDEREIECWKHGSTFSLITGEPQSLPATKAEPVYEVQIVDGAVSVVVSGEPQ